MANQSGDGKNSPFTGGSGGGGNNFVTNPRGTNLGTKPPDLINTSRTQPRGGLGDLNSQDAAPGGAIPVATPPANRPGGAGTVGSGYKPFRVGGG